MGICVIRAQRGAGQQKRQEKANTTNVQSVAEARSNSTFSKGSLALEEPGWQAVLERISPSGLYLHAPSQQTDCNAATQTLRTINSNVKCSCCVIM